MYPILRPIWFCFKSLGYPTARKILGFAWIYPTEMVSYPMYCRTRENNHFCFCLVYDNIYIYIHDIYIYTLYIHSKLHKNVPDMLTCGTLHRPSIAIESAAGYLKIHEATIRDRHCYASINVKPEEYRFCWLCLPHVFQ